MHEKYVTGRCHKHPKGTTHCSLTKTSSFIDCTKPVQLIDVILPQKPTEKVTITYEMDEEIQSQKSAIFSLQPQN